MPPRMSPVVVLASIVGALGALRGAARAGACAAPHLWVLPAGSAPLPTNVELRVVFAASTVEVLELVDEQTRAIAAHGTVSAADADVLIRAAASGAPVPVSARRTEGTALPGFVVAPLAPLAPSTAYALVVRAGGAEYVVARFTTADGPDDAPPALAPIRRATVYQWQPSRPPHWKDVHGRFAEVTVGVTDAVGFEIHEAKGDEAPSLATLRAVVPASAGASLRFGALDSCHGPDLALPVSRAPMRLWIRAFDAAGNVSPARAVTLDLAHPRRRR